MEKLIPEDEQLYSASFVTRMRERPLAKKWCADKAYEWAELKTSLLVVSLLDTTASSLANFLYMTVRRLYGNNSTKMLNEIKLYLSNPQNNNEDIKKLREQSPSNNDKEHFPIGGFIEKIMKNTVVNPSDIRNNFFGMVNFSTWVWGQILKGPVTSMSAILHVQQKMMEIHRMIRGRRVDSNQEIHSNQYGITTIDDDEILALGDQDHPYKPLKPWNHWGQSKCQVAYRGMYGALIKWCRENNLDCGSMQCGISGSTQIFLFTVLASLVGDTTKDELTIQGLVHDVILVSIIILAGEGGHNVVEIISGLVTSVIVLKYLLDNPDLLEELYAEKILSGARSYVQEFINPTKGAAKFINIFYEMTLDINPVNDFSHINKPLDSESIKSIDSRMREFLLKNPTEYNKIRDNKEWFNNVTAFLWKDANRYMNTKDYRNREKIKLLSYILSLKPETDKIEENVDKLLREKIEGCEQTYTEYNYAFGSKAPKKATKKASKKSVKKATKKSVKKAAKKSSRRSVKKAAKKSAKKAAKKSGRRSVKKATKKSGRRSVKKAAKKSVRRSVKKTSNARRSVKKR